METGRKPGVPILPEDCVIAACVTCKVSFSLPEHQREHHKSDWHRYNLKRRLASLPPISIDLFKAKLLAQLDEKSEIENVKEGESRCECCRKSFGTKASLDNHLSSKKHKENAAKTPVREPTKVVEAEPDEAMESGGDSDSEWSEGDDGLGLEECLFCDKSGADMDAKLAHMATAHSFFIPDLQYCSDLPGFLLYLGQKIGEGLMCLWCNERGKSFHTLDGVQKHMRDKGHCRIAHDDVAWIEYADFFDFSSSYPDGAEANPDAPAELPELEERDWQLILPSGCTIGHRDLQRYFRQRPTPENSSLVMVPGQRRLKPQEKNLGHGHYRALQVQQRSLGWTGTSDLAVVRKRARDQAFMQKIRNKRYMKLGMAGNSHLRHRFRDQTIVF